MPLPAMPGLTRDEILRYSRHLLIPEVGLQGQRKLKGSSALIIGTGGLGSPVALYLAAAGVGLSAFFYLKRPDIPAAIKHRFSSIYTLLDNKYYFDKFNDWFFAGGARALGTFLSNVGDRTIIDGFFVNGSARLVALVSREFRRIQSGYVYHYAFVMIVGVFGLLYWWGVR